MPGHPRLPTKLDEIAQHRRSGNAGLGDDDDVSADDAVVSDHDEVVDFGAFTDPCAAEAGAVDGGVGADLHIILQHHGADRLRGLKGVDVRGLLVDRRLAVIDRHGQRGDPLDQCVPRLLPGSVRGSRADDGDGHHQPDLKAALAPVAPRGTPPSRALSGRSMLLL